MEEKKSIKQRDFFRLLNLLSDKELSLFYKYNEQHRLIKNDKVSRFIIFLKKNLKKENKLTIEHIHNEVFNHGKGNNINKDINQLLRDSKKQFKNFIFWLKFKEQDFTEQFPCLHFLSEKKVPNDLFKKELKEIQKRQKAKHPIKNLDYFSSQQELIELELSHYISLQARIKIGNLYEQKHNNSYQIYIIRTLMDYCTFLNHYNTSGANTKKWQAPQFSDFIMNHLKRSNSPRILVIDLWYTLALLLKSTTNEEQYYNQLNQLAESYLKEIKINNIENKFKKNYLRELLQIYTALLSYEIRQTEQQTEGGWQRLFNIYEFVLKEEIIFVGDFFRSHQDFKNIVSTALRLKKYEWTNNFITDYKARLADDSQAHTALYCRSLIDFSQKKYQSCLEKLDGLAKEKQNGNTKNITNKNTYRILRIKCCYEHNTEKNGDIEIASLHNSKESSKKYALEDCLENFLENLKYMKLNNQLHAEKIQRHRNFISIVHQLNEVRRNHRQHITPKKYNELVKNINKKEILTERKWLEEKLKELL